MVRTMRNGWARIIAGMALTGLATPLSAQMFSSPGYDFLKAVKDRDGTKVEEALSKPGNTVITARDDNGDTALHIVTKRRDVTWLRYLLSKGAPMNTKDRDGNTALMDAARIGFVEAEQQLVDVGASVNLANDRGETPLIIAAQQRDLASVRILVAAGADPRETDHVAGLSALDYAKRDGRSDVIIKLLESAKPTVKKQVSGPALN